MKASPFFPLIFSSFLLVLSISVLAQSGQYTVQVDSVTAQEAAESKVQTLKSQGQNAYWLKSNVPGQGLRYRVRIGRFPTRVAAQNFGARLKQQGVAADFFVALFEGATSPLGTPTPVKKVAPAPVLSATPKTVPAENKAAENKTAEDKPTPASQRQREVKTLTPPTLVPAAPANSTADKRVNSVPSPGTVAKPIVTPQPVAPTTPPPSNNAAPKSTAPTENKPLQSKPLMEEAKPPRDKKAENVTPNNSLAPAPTSTVAAATKTEAPVEKEIKGPAASAVKQPESLTSVTASSVVPTDAFSRFEERTFGYSFEHPNYWNGGRLSQDELQAQRIDAGAVFRSQEDVAFTSAIWNSLKNANSPAYDNNLIVDLVIKSLSSSTGLQGLNEVSRRMVQEGDQIKTFVDLRTLFRQPRANTPLEFQGKAVIIRANTGILLVVTFYSKDGAPTMVAAAERIISSARVP